MQKDQIRSQLTFSIICCCLYLHWIHGQITFNAESSAATNILNLFPDPEKNSRKKMGVNFDRWNCRNYKTAKRVVNIYGMVACQRCGYSSVWFQKGWLWSDVDKVTHTNTHTKGFQLLWCDTRRNEPSHNLPMVNKSAPGLCLPPPLPCPDTGWAATLPVFVCTVPIYLLQSGSPAYVGQEVCDVKGTADSTSTD